MTLAINEADSGRGTNFQFGSASVHLPTGAIGLGDLQVSGLIRALARSLAVYAAELKEELVQLRLLSDHGGPVISAAASGINAARTEARDAAAAAVVFSTPVRPVEAAFATWVWSTYRAMDAGSQAKAIQSADLDTLAGLVADGGNRGALAPAVLDAATTRYRELNVVERLGLQARFAAQPTIDRILAIGPDLQAAQAEARSLLAAHTDRLAAVQANEKTARDLIGFLAAVFGISEQAVLDRILGRPSGVSNA